MEELARGIETQLKANDLLGALGALEGLQPVDQAEALSWMDPSLGRYLLEKLPLRAEVFGYLDPEEQLALAEQLPRKVLAEVVSEMASDERADLYLSFDEAQRQLFLPGIEKAKREDMRRLSSYAEGCAGALMSSDYAVLDAGMNTLEAIESLRRVAPNAETIYWAYVVDDAHHLLGVVSLRDLIMAPADTRMSELMNAHIISAQVDADQEEVARLVERYDLMALPIVNAQDQLVGIVTHDDALDVLVEEATDDFYKGAGLTSDAGTLGDAPISALYKTRIFWLALLVFGNLFSGAAIGAYEQIIEAHLVLVFFLPLLIGSGGNAGSQSATLMVRAIATGEVRPRDWLRLLVREAAVAFLLGLTLACLVAILGYLRDGLTVALVLTLAMLAIVMIGCIIGMGLPFILSRFNMDPATASAPLVTSICDVAGVLVYLSIASQLLPLG